MGVKVDFKVNVPHGEMDITENGQYDVSDYALANVNIAFETEEKSVTIIENGTQEVLPSVGKDALSKVVINTEIPIKEEQSKNVEIKENGTISVLPDEGKVLNEVSITTNVPQDNTLKKLLDATHSCYYLFSNYSGTSVDDIIQPNDTENVTNMTNMFYNCKSLTTIPPLDTSKVTYMDGMLYQCSNLTTVPLLNTGNVINMSAMFFNCSSLTTVPQLDTRKVTDMGSVFYNCNKLTTIPQLNTSNVTNMYQIFYNCKSLTTGPQLDTSNVTDMASMFRNCNSLTAVPLYNTSKVTNMSQMFWHCSNLQTIPAFECTNVKNMNNIFASCSSLKSILMTNIGVNLDISASTRFEREDLVLILNNLKTVTTTKTLKMGATNLAKLTDEDKLIATNKGWTLA